MDRFIELDEFLGYLFDEERPVAKA